MQEKHHALRTIIHFDYCHGTNKIDQSEKESWMVYAEIIFHTIC